MKHQQFFSVLSALIIFSACASPETSVTPDPTVPAIPPELSQTALASAQYTLIDPAVRKALTEAGEDFSVRMQDGSYSFQSSALLEQYSTVTVDTEDITYGDLTADGVLDAVVPVTVGTGEFASTELAAFSGSGGTAYQFAAFPLGRAVIRSVYITEGKIRVNFTHNVLGDPGPRNTELVLEIPKK